MVRHARAETTGANDGDALFERVARIAAEAMDGAPPPVAIGCGCGGPQRWPEGVVSPLHIPAWRDFPLRDRLERRFGIPAIVDNDAKAMALGECWRGAGRGARCVLGMVVSTGVGGGIVLDGRLVDGAHGHAGHIGHVQVWPDGPTCACGAPGCLSAVASGTGIAARIALARERALATTLPPGATARVAAEHARAGDDLARSLFVDAGRALGRAIASATALVDLDVVVIGGGIALGAWDLIGPSLEEELRLRSRIAFARDLRVTRAALGEDAGLYGAAALALGTSQRPTPGRRRS
jgi:glucokinase